MASERMTVDISADEHAQLVSEYIYTNMSEATLDLINEEYPEITGSNFKEAASVAMLNEMVISILEKQIEEEKKKKEE